MSKGKILDINLDICLFCGNPEIEHWDDNERYYECDCKDAVLIRKINSEIEQLKLKLPEPRFEIVCKDVLYKIDN